MRTSENCAFVLSTTFSHLHFRSGQHRLQTTIARPCNPTWRIFQISNGGRTLLHELQPTRLPCPPPPIAAMNDPAEEICFSVKNNRGEALSCILDAGLESKPVAVFVHGFRDSKNGSCVRGVSSELAARGTWRILRFDCSGNGQSEGQFQYANYEEEMEDLRAVVLHARGELGVNVNCIVGHSKGAGVVILYAQKYRDITYVISLAARFHMSAGVKERFGDSIVRKCMEEGQVAVTLKDGFSFVLTKESLEQRLSLDMGRIAATIPPDISVLTVHGDADTTISVSDAFEFDQRIPNHTLCVLPGACHNLKDSYSSVVDALTKLTG